MASQNQMRKNPQFPESARAFTTALGAPRAAFPSSVTCGTPPRVICVSVRGVGATARRAVDLHPALFSLLCRERVDGCAQSCSTATCVPQSTLAARGSVAQSARPASEVSAAAPGELTPRDLRTRWSAASRVRRGCGGKIPERRSSLEQTAAGLWRSVHGLAGRLQRDHRPQS